MLSYLFTQSGLLTFKTLKNTIKQTILYNLLQRLDKKRKISSASLKNESSKINQNKQVSREVLMIIKIYKLLACPMRIAFILCIQD